MPIKPSSFAIGKLGTITASKEQPTRGHLCTPHVPTPARPAASLYVLTTIVVIRVKGMKPQYTQSFLYWQTCLF